MAEKLDRWITPEDIAREDKIGGLTHIDMSSVRENTCGMLETDLADGWVMVEVFEMHDGKPIVAELKIFPKPPTKRKDSKGRPLALDVRNFGHRSPESNGDVTPDGGITASLLREVRLGMKHATPILEHYREWLTNNKYVDLSEDVERFDKQIGRPSHAKTGERRRETDEYYAKISVQYERLCAEGSRSPVKSMAEDHGVKLGRMRSHIHRARRNGFLTDAVQGKKGGAATEKALEILKGTN